MRIHKEYLLCEEHYYLHSNWNKYNVDKKQRCVRADTGCYCIASGDDLTCDTDGDLKGNSLMFRLSSL